MRCLAQSDEAILCEMETPTYGHWGVQHRAEVSGSLLEVLRASILIESSKRVGLLKLPSWGRREVAGEATARWMWGSYPTRHT